MQSAVVGRRVSGNEEVVAFVETMPGSAVDEAALKAFVRERLAPYKRPQHIFVMARMPASATGKVQKHALAALADELIARKAASPDLSDVPPGSQSRPSIPICKLLRSSA